MKKVGSFVFLRFEISYNCHGNSVAFRKKPELGNFGMGFAWKDETIQWIVVRIFLSAESVGEIFEIELKV